MLLTIFSKNLDHLELFNKILNNLQQNSLLLIQDGVYFGLNINNNTNNIYALKPDVIIRGLINYPANIKLINYHEFVNLIIEHNNNVTY
jgi:sulfur relay protein TusB/DsrH